ncbi:MAG: hypothetical protein Q7R79_04890 [bacterium]|nr:hypothetical protein [bacterium]
MLASPQCSLKEVEIMKRHELPHVSIVVRKTVEILKRDFYGNVSENSFDGHDDMERLQEKVTKEVTAYFKEKRLLDAALSDTVLTAADILEKILSTPIKKNREAMILLEAALTAVVHDMGMYPGFPESPYGPRSLYDIGQNFLRYHKTGSTTFEKLSHATLDIAELLSRGGFDGFQYNEPMNYLRSQLGSVIDYATPIAHPGLGHVDWISLRKERKKNTQV